MVKAVIGETPFLLQVEDESPHLVVADLGSVGAYSLCSEKTLKVAHAIGDNGDGIWAFTFSRSTEPVTLKQSSYIGGKI